jgi:hypothetical protein
MKKISITFLIFIVSCSLMAQVVVQNNGIGFISTSSDILFINGSFTNTSGAALTNNGSLYIKGNITNDQSAMAAGSGTLYLNGTGTQIISGTQTFKTFNLITDNSFGITLNNNLSATGTHTFTSGLITTSATPNYMIYESGSSYSGDDDNKHVVGWVKKIGSTNFVFPVGNGTYERSIALTNLTAGSEFNIRHYDGPTPNYNNLISPIVLIDTNEYWRINKISGANAQVLMNWDNNKIPIPQVLITGIRSGYYNGSFWINIGGTGVGDVTTTGTVTSNSVSAFNNNFTIASTSWVLPLDIISFSGIRNVSYNHLNWIIGNELNVLQYELQRSTDGLNFTTINIQDAKNYYATALYSYDDVTAVQGKLYYRLRCLNKDGQIKYSGIVIIASSQNDKKDFYVIKNPVTDKIDIYVSDNLKGIYNYTVANNAGQVVQTGLLKINPGGIYSIQLQSWLSSGIYMLVLRNGDNVLQKNILKE